MDERAQITPIEVMFTVMITIITMGFLSLIVFPIVDSFLTVINEMDIPLSSWGLDMMNILVVPYSRYVFLVPGFFCLLIMVWAIKTVIRKHQYTAQDQQFMSDEYQ